MWVENNGTVTDEKWASYRVQVFSLGQTIYYVMYYFATNLFVEVRVNQIDKVTASTA